METRDLGFIKWTDTYGALEHNGPALTAAIEEENNRLEAYVKTLDKTHVKAWQELFANEPKTHPAYYNYRWQTNTIYVNEYNRYMPNYTIKPPEGKTLNLEGALALGTTERLLWSVEDRSEGREELSLTLYNSKLDSILTIKDVGDSTGHRGETIYYLGAEERLWFNSLNLIRNRQSFCIYKEEIPKYSLSIVQPKYQQDLFLLRKSALYQDLALVTPQNRLVWLSRGYGRKIPITRDIIAYNTYLEIEKTRVDYPPHHYILEGYRKGTDLYCTFSTAAKQALYCYSMKTNRWSAIVPAVVGEISIIESIDGFLIGYPNKPDIVISESKDLLFRGEGPRYAIESGSEPVPWFLVHPGRKPRGLVVVGYGSYGMHTKKSQVRLWQPWLVRGYAIATLCVRGGGEVGDDWWEGGRTPYNLRNRVTDFVEGTLALQKRFSFDKSNTIIYGRSAGGFLVTAAAYYLMEKIAAVYAAKPYTDLLRTTANGHAGQTLQESDEFGYVEHDPVGFKYNFEISPYENAPLKPKVNPAVLLTTGTNDAEVPHFQPVRYAKRLNDLGWKNVLCRVAEDEGHFTKLKGESGEALDAAILDSFLDDNARKLTPSNQFSDTRH
uniref:Peptidase S9 prolyl oligopeptidase catalytic domain-containing protein n=1 Tax=viral metagenome TaxID=1070528 RepID=A0A6C0DR63_9ZZZZ